MQKLNSSFVSSRHKGVVLHKRPAGKLIRTESNSIITSDPRPGTLYLLKSDDGSLHFCWQDLSFPNAEDDIVVHSPSASNEQKSNESNTELKRLLQCKDGVAYVFKHNQARSFYWIQEKKTQEEEETWCSAVNTVLHDTQLRRDTSRKSFHRLISNIKVPQEPQLLDLFRPKEWEKSLEKSPMLLDRLLPLIPKELLNERREKSEVIQDILYMIKSGPFIHTVKSLSRILNHGDTQTRRALLSNLGLPSDVEANVNPIQILIRALKEATRRNSKQ